MKIGIITINDLNNYGNRLQNYAVSKVLTNMGIENESIKNLQIKKSLKSKVKQTIKKFLRKKQQQREECFKQFDKNIEYSLKTIDNNNFFNIQDDYDFFIVGSDQVWNPTFNRLSNVDLLTFAKDEQKIAFSASFGIEKLDELNKKKVKEYLKNFKAISVREYKGKEIIEEVLDRRDTEVLVDPTMLLTTDEWDKVAKKPKQLKCDKYILNYFLGELSEERKKEINRIAKENNCEVINILDEQSPFYQTGPSEFLYLEKNAFLICTDSFHSSVFAILYDRPFIVFDREDKEAKMSSRIETLINKFNLKNRKFEGKIIEENLEHDYTEAYKILEKEREKANKFLEKCLNVK